MEQLTTIEEAKARQKNKISKHRPAKASTTKDSDARIERMPDQGYRRPAHRLQLAQDPLSRAIVGVAVGSNDKEEGAEMREQIQQRTGSAVQTHIFDGNYVKPEDNKPHMRKESRSSPRSRSREKRGRTAMLQAAKTIARQWPSGGSA